MAITHRIAETAADSKFSTQEIVKFLKSKNIKPKKISPADPSGSYDAAIDITDSVYLSVGHNYFSVSKTLPSGKINMWPPRKTYEDPWSDLKKAM